MASVTHLAWELMQAMGLGFVAMPAFATGLFALARIAETLDPARAAHCARPQAQRLRGRGTTPR